MLRCIFCVLASYVLFSFVATFGQESQPQVKKKIVYKEKSYYDFEDTLIKGNKPSPDGTSVFRKERTAFPSELNLRRSFKPEAQSSGTEVW